MGSTDTKAKKPRKKLGLTSAIFIALGLGIVCGVIFHYFIPEGFVRDDVFVNGIFYVVGQGFIRLMQMLVVPLVFCSIVCGAAAIGDTKTLEVHDKRVRSQNDEQPAHQRYLTTVRGLGYKIDAPIE